MALLLWPCYVPVDQRPAASAGLRRPRALLAHRGLQPVLATRGMPGLGSADALLLLLLALVTSAAAQPLAVSLRASTGTVASLACAGEGGRFDFVGRDGDWGANRTAPGLLALGDVSLRVRPASEQLRTVPPPPGVAPFPGYTRLSSGFGDPGMAPLCCGRPLPAVMQTRPFRWCAAEGVTPLPLQPGELAAHDMTAQLGAAGTPLRLERCERMAASGVPAPARACSPLACRRYGRPSDTAGGLTMRYVLRNTDAYNALEVGALGLPLCFQVGRFLGPSCRPARPAADGARACRPAGTA